ncbi:hypothetical protein AB205_0176960 [Aquarana catesbeiana]|uniref:Uncharacterized protein n=1 Tax=Aquarana catesbeiana TaxID=8400 RepID=A0A2G9RB85_AQUCT|nr:hypothetical protein AB205_0176960 [Aquarana catesbeiana]
MRTITGKEVVNVRGIVIGNGIVTGKETERESIVTDKQVGILRKGAKGIMEQKSIVDCERFHIRVQHCEGDHRRGFLSEIICMHCAI